MKDFGLIITIVLPILLYIPIGIFIHKKYLSDKRRFIRIERIAFLSIEMLFVPFFILLVIGKFMGGIPTWDIFLLLVFGLVVLNLVFIIAQHLSEAYLGYQIEQRREKMLNMPDSPKKWKMEKEQAYMEDLWKNR